MIKLTPNKGETNVKSNCAEFLIEILASNITKFHHEEHNLTFDMWYARYEDLLSVDAPKLDDSAKVRLLLTKFSPMMHSKYVNFISPKYARDFKLQKSIEKLITLFILQPSQFNVRYNCLQITKDPASDFITWTGTVDSQCEFFKLNDLTLDQFKCLSNL